jgi:hypothetical protein
MVLRILFQREREKVTRGSVIPILHKKINTVTTKINFWEENISKTSDKQHETFTKMQKLHRILIKVP